MSLPLTRTRVCYSADKSPIAIAIAIAVALAVVGTAPVSGQVINEFVANHTGTDNYEYVEIFGDPATDYSDLRIIQIEGDTEDQPGGLDSAIAVGTSDANGLWWTGFLSNEVHNGTMTLLLVDGYDSTPVGTDLDTDNDGVLDLQPWTLVIDAVAVFDDSSANDRTYGTPVLGPNYDGLSQYPPGGASRIPDGADSDATTDWVRNDFNGAGLPGYSGDITVGEAYNTPGEPNQWLQPPTPVINEVVANHTGDDTHEYVELAGLAGTDYSGIWVLIINGDGSAAGNVDRAYEMATTNASGYWSSGFLSDEIENGTLTLMLVSSFTGAVDDDLDTNNDGTLDVTPYSELHDAVAISDGDANDRTYAATVLDPNLDGLGSTPGGISRVPDGIDTDTTADWVRNDFDGAGLDGFVGSLSATEAYNTPGAVNLVSVAGYYAGVSGSDPATLRASVAGAIADHKRYPYSSSNTDTWDILETADENPEDSNAVLTIYKNATYTKFGGGSGAYNREHSWPNSLGFGDNDDGNYPYTDCHQLFLSNPTYNSDRSNHPFGTCDEFCAEYPTDYNNGVGGGSGTYPGNSNWLDASSRIWEVWHHRRGDIARAQLYMDVRYEGNTHGVTGYAEPDLELIDDVGQITSGQPYMGRLSVLLYWHEADPVSAGERDRNEVIYSFQGNRNPFVDHPEWVDCIFSATNCGLFSDGFETGDTTAWSAAVP